VPIGRACIRVQAKGEVTVVTAQLEFGDIYIGLCLPIFRLLEQHRRLYAVVLRY